MNNSTTSFFIVTNRGIVYIIVHVTGPISIFSMRKAEMYIETNSSERGASTEYGMKIRCGRDRMYGRFDSARLIKFKSPEIKCNK